MVLNAVAFFIDVVIAESSQTPERVVKRSKSTVVLGLALTFCCLFSLMGKVKLYNFTQSRRWSDFVQNMATTETLVRQYLP